jgi:hypothetical protein
MTDNTFKQNTFVLKEDGIYTDDGIQVSNEDEVSQALIDAYDLPYKSGPYTLNCRVELISCDKMGIPNTNYTVAHVTFPEDKPEQKDTYDKSRKPKKPFDDSDLPYFPLSQERIDEIENLVLPKLQEAFERFRKEKSTQPASHEDKPEQKRVTFDEQTEKRCINCNEPMDISHVGICEECYDMVHGDPVDEPEAAGQEQYKGFEGLIRENQSLKDDLYNASQQTASLQKQVEELREENDDLCDRLTLAQEETSDASNRIAELEEALKHFTTPYHCIPSSYTEKAIKALNPQDNQSKP